MFNFIVWLMTWLHMIFLKPTTLIAVKFNHTFCHRFFKIFKIFFSSGYRCYFANIIRESTGKQNNFYFLLFKALNCPLKMLIGKLKKKCKSLSFLWLSVNTWQIPVWHNVVGTYLAYHIPVMVKMLCQKFKKTKMW